MRSRTVEVNMAASSDLEAARLERQRAEEALERTREQSRIDERTVLEPLRRNRRQMLEHNHVYDNVRRMLGEGRS